MLLMTYIIMIVADLVICDDDLYISDHLSNHIKPITNISPDIGCTVMPYVYSVIIYKSLKYIWSLYGAFCISNA